MAEPTRQIIRSGLAGVTYRNAPDPYKRGPSLGEYITQAANEAIDVYKGYQENRKEMYLAGVKDFGKYTGAVYGEDQKAVKEKEEEYRKKLTEKYRSGAKPTEISEFVASASSELQAFVTGSNSFKENGLKGYEFVNKDKYQDIGAYEAWYREQSLLPPSERRDPLEAVQSGEFVNTSSAINEWVENNMQVKPVGITKTENGVTVRDTYSIMPEITKMGDDGTFELNLTTPTIDSYAAFAKENDRLDHQYRLRIAARKLEEFQQGVTDFRDKSPNEQYRIVAGDDLKLQLAKAQIAKAKSSQIIPAASQRQPSAKEIDLQINNRYLKNFSEGVKSGDESVFGQFISRDSKYGIKDIEYIMKNGVPIGVEIEGLTKEDVSMEEITGQIVGIKAKVAENMPDASEEEIKEATEVATAVALSKMGADKDFKERIYFNPKDEGNVLNNFSRLLRSAGFEVGVYLSGGNPEEVGGEESNNVQKAEVINALNGK